MATGKKKTSSSAKKKAVAIEKVRSRIKHASELEDPLRMLLYGRSGTQKTRTGATAPDVLVIDVNEKGTKSTSRDTDPNVFVAEYWQDVIDVYWFLESGNHEFGSYLLDGITAMQNLCMKFVLGDEASRDASRDPDMPSRQIWNKVGELMKTQITNYRNLPMNGIFTALQRVKFQGEEGDDEEGEVYISPACSPSISGHLEAAVDIIGHMTTREVRVKKKGQKKAETVIRRFMLVGPSERYLTKDRTGLFGDRVRNPDVAKMIRIYNGKEA